MANIYAELFFSSIWPDFDENISKKQSKIIKREKIWKTSDQIKIKFKCDF